MVKLLLLPYRVTISIIVARGVWKGGAGSCPPMNIVLLKIFRNFFWSESCPKMPNLGWKLPFGEYYGQNYNFEHP